MVVNVGFVIEMFGYTQRWQIMMVPRRLLCIGIGRLVVVRLKGRLIG